MARAAARQPCTPPVRDPQADQRRKGADNYAREVLFALEERVADTLGQVRGGIDLLDTRPAVNVAD